MNPSPNREVVIFNAALELPASQPGAYLQEACADDPALRLQIEALLRVHEEAGAFLEPQASGAKESVLSAEVTGVSGANWVPTSAPVEPWTSAASSADGTRLAAVSGEPYAGLTRELRLDGDKLDRRNHAPRLEPHKPAKSGHRPNAS